MPEACTSLLALSNISLISDSLRQQLAPIILAVARFTSTCGRIVSGVLVDTFQAGPNTSSARMVGRIEPRITGPNLGPIWAAKAQNDSAYSLYHLDTY